MTNQLLLAAALSLLVMTASAKVEVYGCSGAVQSDYCAPTPTGEKTVPGFTVDDLPSPTGTPITITVPATTNPSKQPTSAPAPQTAQAQTTTTYAYGQTKFTTAAGACNAFWADQGALIINNGYTNAHLAGPNAGGTSCIYYLNAGTSSPQSYGTGMETTSVCPTGYQSSGGTNCTKKSDAAVPDGKKGIKAAGDPPAYTPATDDGDNINSNTPIVQPSPNQVQIPTKGANGQNQQVTGTITATGSSIVVQSQETGANGTTVVKTTTYTFDGAGNHIGTSVTNSQGNLTGGGTGGTYTPSTTGQSAFPNDYAKSGEAQAAANTTNAKLDQIKDTLTQPTAETDGSAEIPTFSNGFGDTFNGLSAWSLPAHASNCPTGTFNIFDSTVVMDSHCILFEQIRPTLSLSAVAFWVVFALFIVLGA